MKRLILFFYLLSIVACANSVLANSAPAGVTTDGRGVVLPVSGNALLCVQMVRPDIVRVRYSLSGEIADANPTGVCVPHTDKQHFPVSVEHKGKGWHIVTDSLFVEVPDNGDGIVYRDRRTGRIIAREETLQPRSGKRVIDERIIYDEKTRRIEHTADGEKEVRDVLRRDTVGSTWTFSLRWHFDENEAVYGLGSHMEDYMNLRDKKVFLCQHNLKAMVPVLNSTGGYGLLIDAGSEMVYDHGRIDVGAAPQLDYYFMKGASMDRTISAYRWLTGHSPMMPRYLFGYIQSKERYRSSNELLQTLGRLRSEHIPVDMIVQDWNYWKSGSWGYMKMNERDFPDKRALADSIHAQHARLMISIWPTFSNSPQADDFDKRGLMIPGTNAYDAFRAEARDLYWDYASKEFFDNGFDAWWCDASEPYDADWKIMDNPNYTAQSHEERWRLCSDLLAGRMGHERSQLFSLYHAQGIYEHQRAASQQKRVVNLTRSSYAGQQRYSTITWNGDTYASWESFAQMIPAGLNFMATGCPYWSVDVGAFFTKKKPHWFWAGQYDQGVNDMGYRELYARMLQYATFLPVMRSHGTDTPREPWQFGAPGDPFYESILSSIRLRYSLLPYTYSQAWKVSQDDYTLTRALAFDFPHDKRVHDIKDEFLFGSSLLVAPVTTPMYYTSNSTPVEGASLSRSVYLPQSSGWYDFWTGKRYKGGQHVTTAAPIDRIPLFVRQGTILPMLDEQVEWSDAADSATMAIRIYTGQDASFTLYEDGGDGYQYEKDEYATIQLKWDDKRGMLHIGQRQGAYRPRLQQRQLHIYVVGGKKTEPILCEYMGEAVDVDTKTGMISQVGYQPSAGNLAARREFEGFRFGIFLHWGLYAQFAQGEWYLNNGINGEEYAKAASCFYPARFDAAAWVRAIKQSGARYITFTTRHHDSFSMWKTAQSPYNIVDATPYGRDVLKELSQACQQDSMPLFLYYSLLDWVREDYPMGWTGKRTGRKHTPNYDSYLQFMKNQMHELLTQYGPIRGIWLDGYWDHGKENPLDWRMPEFYRYVHGLRPDCLIGNNHHVSTIPGEDFQMFERDLPGENTAGMSAQDISTLPLEMCQTMNGMWGYKVADQNYKSTDELVSLIVRAAAKGCNLLLNIGPQPNGELPAMALERLQGIGQRM